MLHWENYIIDSSEKVPSGYSHKQQLFSRLSCQGNRTMWLPVFSSKWVYQQMNYSGVISTGAAEKTSN